MAYKTISVILTDVAADGPALRAAIAIAAREHAHLDVHCIGIDPTRYEAVPVAGAGIVLESGMAEARDRAQELVAWAQKEVTADLLTVAVQPVVTAQVGLDITVSRLARYSDLVVATRPYGPGRDARHVAVVESALFATGAPVLVVPDAPRDWSQPFRRIVIAWDESDVSLEAIRDSMPFLRAAGHVDLVMVDPPAHSPERSDPGGAVALMLNRQGIKAEVSILARTLPRVSEIITRYVQEHGADAIVMGAYGHSRFREALLGGATREMLEAAPVALLMSH